MSRLVIPVVVASSEFNLMAAKTSAQASPTAHPFMGNIGGKEAADVGELSAWGGSKIKS